MFNRIKRRELRGKMSNKNRSHDDSMICHDYLHDLSRQARDFVYLYNDKRKLNRRLIYECRRDERLNAGTDLKHCLL